MKLNRPFLALASVIVLVGCSNPADKVPSAKVSDAPSGASTSPPAAGGTHFAFGPADSKVEFTASKVTGSHSGGFKDFVGEFQVVDGKLADTGTKVVIKTDSLFSDAEGLTKHLKTPDFFDVAQFPTATFESTKIEQAANGATVAGALTLHGVTKTISFPATISVAADQVTLKSEFSINRMDFGIKYAGKSDDLIRPEVVIKLDVVAKPGNATFAATEGEGVHVGNG